MTRRDFLLSTASIAAVSRMAGGNALFVQLHWQNTQPGKHGETIFVAQDEIRDEASAKRVYERFLDIIDQRQDECPRYWSAMICTQNADCFVKVAQ